MYEGIDWNPTLAMQVQYVLENPKNSWLFKMPCVLRVLVACNAVSVGTCLCRYGMNLVKELELCGTFSSLNLLRRLPPRQLLGQKRKHQESFFSAEIVCKSACVLHVMPK